MITSKSNSGRTCLRAALNLLSKRPMTTCTIRKRLKAKGYAAEEIEAAIDRLIEWKYLDDHSFAVSLIKSKSKKQSRKKVYYDLIRAGIDQELADSLLVRYYPDQLELENCLVLAHKLLPLERQKWQRKVHKSTVLQEKEPEIIIYQKLRAKLLLKGYSLSTVHSALAQVFERENY
ncbi:MAG: hypothetical protein GX207_04540 [Peptococcaceae bacterium]|nr:hypothetical protein [Peptococcaceae bacterium]